MESVIQVLHEALTKDPENQDMRQHLLELLVSSERWEEALSQAQTLLARAPDHLKALAAGAQAAEKLNRTDLAQAYNRLHAALAPSQTTPPVETQDRHIEPGPFAQPNTTSGSAAPHAVPHIPKDRDTTGKHPALRVVAGGADLDPEGFEQEADLTLADVVGMEQVKHRLDLAFLAPLRNPEMRKLYGKSLRGGLMLYGPPGCGKTFIARATAGELGARFITIGLSDVLDMYIGQSERNLHEIFESARRKAPCVLFLDEIDALGRKRSLRRNHADRDIVNQLLAELDGVQNQNDGLFVLAASNHPWDVDEALRRPGRLDRALLVLPPDEPARVHLLRQSMTERPHQDIDFEAIAAKTDGYSCADIVHLCDSATELAMSDSITSGKVRPVSAKDFQRVLKDVRATTRPWFETARNFALFANEGGAYDELADYLRKKRFL